MRRRTILIEEAPDMFISGGLIYCDFRIADGSVIAFRPSVWLATSAIGQQITREWRDGGADVLPLTASNDCEAGSG